MDTYLLIDFTTHTMKDLRQSKGHLEETNFKDFNLVEILNIYKIYINIHFSW